MATRRRTASWIQPPSEEKGSEKGGHRAKEGMVGGGGRYHFTPDYSEREGAPSGRGALWVTPLVQCGLSRDALTV